MVKQLFLSASLGGLVALASYASLSLLLPESTHAAQTVIQKIVEPGPSFDPPEITIKAGDTVQWTVMTPRGIPHHLVGDNSSDAFTATKQFDASTAPPVTETFNSPGVIHYHCTFHPTTMKGTLTVTP
jgi:plastocyanin